MNTYVNFVRNHSLLVRPVEGLLRTVTFFLPSRFHENGNGEITTEAALAASNVLTLVNDLILLRPGTNTAALLPQAEDRIGLVLMLISHTEVLLEKVSIRLGDGAEHLVVLCLEALKALLRLKLLHLQQQQGGAGTKLLLDGGRVIPFFDNPSLSPLPSTTTTIAGAGGMAWGPASESLAVDAEEEDEEETLLRGVVRGSGGGSEGKRREENGSRQEWKRGRRTGRKFLYYASGESNEVVEEGKNTSDDEDDHDSSSSPTSSSSSSSSSASSSTSSVPSLGASFTAAAKDDLGPGLAVRSMEEEEAVVAKARARLLLTGEVLHILRPLLFAYLRWLVARRRRRAQRPVAVAASVGSGRGRTTIPGPFSSFPSAGPEWLPLLLPGLMDAVSHQCTMSAIDRNATLKRSYQDELQRRKNLWLLYLLRTPVFEGLTQPVAGALDRSLGRVPLVGGLTNYGFQALLYVQRHFTLTSGS